MTDPRLDAVAYVWTELDHAISASVHREAERKRILSDLADPYRRHLVTIEEAASVGKVAFGRPSCGHLACADADGHIDFCREDDGSPN